MRALRGAWMFRPRRSCSCPMWWPNWTPPATQAWTLSCWTGRRIARSRGPAKPPAGTGGSSRSMRSLPEALRAWGAAAIAGLALLGAGTVAAAEPAHDETIAERDQRLISEALAARSEGRPLRKEGRIGLYA